MTPQTLMKTTPRESAAVAVGANDRIDEDKEVVVMDRVRYAKIAIAVKLKEGRP